MIGYFRDRAEGGAGKAPHFFARIKKIKQKII